MKDKEEFIEKYRIQLGCKNPYEMCWCKICVLLEKIWDDIHKQISKKILKGI